MELRERVAGGVRLADRVVTTMSDGRAFDSAWCALLLRRAARREGDASIRETFTACRDAIEAAKGSARFAAERYRLGGLVGAHVATWAALHPTSPIPPAVDFLAERKFEAATRRRRRRITDARSRITEDDGTRSRTPRRRWRRPSPRRRATPRGTRYANISATRANAAAGRGARRRTTTGDAQVARGARGGATRRGRPRGRSSGG